LRALFSGAFALLAALRTLLALLAAGLLALLSALRSLLALLAGSR
jgi:hypothetical protein